MKQEYYLIIGASGTSGQAAIEAVRKKRSGAFVVGTTTSDQQIEHCDQSITQINFKDPESVQKIISALPKDVSIEMMAFIPAKGRVAMPANKATEQQVKDSVRFSISPMLKLMEVLKPKITVCHSAFIQMPILQNIYGAMNFTKYFLDNLAIQHPDKLKAIRFGIFKSQALMGIGLLVERALAAGVISEKNPFVAGWKNSGLSLVEWLKQYGTQCEKEAFEKQFEAPYRLTEPQDITRAYEMVLDGEKAPLINVIGEWTWADDQLPPLPDDIKKMAENFQATLDIKDLLKK